MVLLMATAVASYFLALGPVFAMQSERLSLFEIADATRAIQVEAGRLPNQLFRVQHGRLAETLERYRNAYGALDGLRVLPMATVELGEAIQAIRNLDDFNRSELEYLLQLLEDIMDKGLALTGDLADLSADWFLYGCPPIYEGEDLEMILLDVHELKSRASSVSEALAVAAEVIMAKSREADSQIETLRARAALLALGIVAGTLALAAGLSLVFAGRIARPIRSMEAGMRRLSGGDLLVQVGTPARDELGILSRDLDSFALSMASSMRGIKDASARNLALRDALGKAVDEAGKSAERIRLDAAEMRTMVGGLDRDIGQADGDALAVKTGAEALAVLVDSEDRMSAELASVVSGLAASIDKAADIAESDHAAALTLSHASEDGTERFFETFERIEEIASDVNVINEMAEIIQNVASQTNLLAMNAAIEAAHAGEAGRGFAVVADEIRKLAEASSENSRRIEDVLASVVSRIVAARESSALARDALATLEDGVKSVARSSDTLHAVIQQLRTGSGRITDGMIRLRAVASDTTESAQTIQARAITIAQATASLAENSRGGLASVDRISEESECITRAVGAVRDHADQVGRVGQTLHERAAVFITE
jgi:methyl-accepting chemotaxis protein